MVGGFAIGILIGLVISLFLNTANNDKYEKLESAYRPIYEILKTEDFKTAKVNDNVVSLYDESMNPIKDIELDLEVKAKIAYIENRGSNMVFWHTGFDDYDGVMFLEGEFTDDIWNGLRRIE